MTLTCHHCIYLKKYLHTDMNDEIQHHIYIGKDIIVARSPVNEPCEGFLLNGDVYIV